LARFENLLTRVEVHVSDENAQKSGAADKRCQIEARPKGHQAISVSHKAAAMTLAVDGAASKMSHALKHLMGKLDSKATPTGRLDDPLLNTESTHNTDALIQEEFLAKQKALGKE
jgi:ribosome-associated translation inhibitor RaiA